MLFLRRGPYNRPADYKKKGKFKNYSNALALVTRRLIGKHQKLFIFYFSTKTFVIITQNNHLKETDDIF